MYDYFARGDREVGNVFRIRNFNSAAFQASNYTNGFVDVGIYTVETAARGGIFQLCGDPNAPLVGVPGPCPYNVIYNTLDNLRPTERPPIIVSNDASPDQRMIVTVLASFALAVTLIMGFLIFRNQNHGLVKVLQPVLVSIVFLGAVLGIIRAFLFLVPVSNAVCKADIAVGHLAVFLVFSTLCVKTWRVKRLMIMTTIAKVKITNTDALLRIGGIVFGLTVYLIIVLVVGNATVLIAEVDANNQITYNLFCGEDIPDLQSSLFAIEACLILAVLNYAQSIRTLPGAVNESNTISLVSLCVLAMAAIRFLLPILTKLPTSTQRFVTALEFIIAVFMVTAGMYGHRIIQALQGQKVSNSYRIGGTDEVATQKAVLEKAAKAAIKAVSSQQRVELGTTQLQFWHAFITALSTDEAFSSSNSSVNDQNELLAVEGASAAERIKKYRETVLKEAKRIANDESKSKMASKKGSSINT